MEIKTKFNVGDTLYTIDRDTLKVKAFEVSEVYVCVTEGSCRIKYKAKDESVYADCYSEDVCFGTRDELFAHVIQ